jgi:hypothetical protein
MRPTHLGPGSWLKAGMIAFVFLVSGASCTVTDSNDSSPTPTTPAVTSIGTAEVTFFNAIDLQINKAVEVYYEDVSNSNADVLLKGSLSPSTQGTVMVPLFSGVGSSINYYFKDSTQPSGLYKGSASSTYDLEVGKKYTIIIYGSSLNYAMLLDNTYSSALPGKAYVRAVNLYPYGVRIKKSTAAGDTDLNIPVGPYNSAATNYVAGDFKNFTATVAGGHAIQSIDYTYSSAGSVKSDFGVKSFAAGKFYTIITQSSSTGQGLYFQIDH